MTTTTAPVTHLTLIPAEHPTLPLAWSDRDALHRAVMSIFPKTLPGEADQRRVTSNILYRVTPQGLLVQSNIAPIATDGMRRTDLSGLLDRLSNGQTVEFMLDVNPVVSTRRADGKTTRRPIPTEDIPAWITERLADVFSNLTCTVTGVETCTVGSTPLRIASVTGIGTITDANALRDLLTVGVGRAKSYGCGMIIVTRSL